MAFKKRRRDLFNSTEEKSPRRKWRLDRDDPDVVLVGKLFFFFCINVVIEYMLNPARYRHYQT